MESILTLNQSIFGTKTKERRISKRALKESVKELYVPQESEEITYDDGYDIDGGGTIKLGIKFTLGAVISSTVVSSIVGYISGYICTKASKLGAMIGGGWGAVIGFAIGGVTSGCLAYILNKIIYPGACGYNETTILTFDCWFLPNFSYYFDLGSLLGTCIGFPGGFAGGYAAGAATALVTV